MQEVNTNETHVRGPAGDSVLQSIRLGQKYQRPPVPTPGQFRADTAPQPDPQSLADLKWFELFKDEKLQDLIRDALTNNYDVRQAVANIDAARANLGITRSQQYPRSSPAATSSTSANRAVPPSMLPEPIKRDRSFGSVLLEPARLRARHLGTTSQTNGRGPRRPARD
jgi:outer membrane protein TolC